VPTYEYRCPDGHEFEQFVQKISLASPELPCPVCGKLAARRMSAGGGFVFKGSGFYITDYGKDGKKDQRDKVEKAAAAQSEAASKSDGVKTDAPAKAEESAPSAGKGGNSGASETSTKADKGEKRSEGAKHEKRDPREKKAPAAATPPASSKKEGGKD
jgi:putative FmdB family regulatory protein